MTDTATGYPELYYFQHEKLLKAVETNQELYDRFVNITLFVDFYDDNANY